MRFNMIPDNAIGQWRVETESSEYLLDFDKKFFVRTAGQSASEFNDDGSWTVMLDADAQIGHPMILWVEPEGYCRQSSPVVSIEYLVPLEAA